MPIPFRPDLEKILKLIAEGTPYRIEQLTPLNHILLVENDQFHLRPDEGHDPYLGFEFAAWVP